MGLSRNSWTERFWGSWPVTFVHDGSENFGGRVSEVDPDEVGTESLVEIDGLTGFFRGLIPMEPGHAGGSL